MNKDSFFSVAWGSWGLSLGVHLGLLGGLLLLAQARATELPLIELDLAWTPSVPAGTARPSLEEEWQNPRTLAPKLSPPPPPREQTGAVVPEAPAPEGPVGEGEGKSRTLAQVDRVPTFLTQTKPQYPLDAQAANIEGVVILQVDIDATGAVKKVVLLRGLGYGCDEAAMDAARNSTFIPALQAGSPVPVTYPLSYRFKLDK